MTSVYHMAAIKKPTNVSINSDLLNKSRTLGINLSATLEQALVILIRQHQQELWLAQSQEAMSAYNHEVDQHGAFGDDLRSF